MDCPYENCLKHHPRAAALEHQLLFTRDDGSQLLVDIWSDGTLQLAERPDAGATWGPPTEGKEV